MKIDLSNETVRSEPKAFVPVVGDLADQINDGGQTRCWRSMGANGRKAGSSRRPRRSKARALYGERYAEFISPTASRPMPISPG